MPSKTTKFNVYNTDNLQPKNRIFRQNLFLDSSNQIVFKFVLDTAAKTHNESLHHKIKEWLKMKSIITYKSKKLSSP